MTQDTRQRILETARHIAAESGIAALTFEAVAQRLGVTKQAVIYWFSTKADLARETALPFVRAEADAAIAAVQQACGADDAVARFVRALVAFHREDFTRFRLVYLAVQVSPRPEVQWTKEAVAEDVHPVTARMYGALADAIAADPSTPPDLDPRRVAATVHMAVLGLVLMVSLGDVIDDPLAHRTEDLVETMVALLNRGVASRSRPRGVEPGTA